MKNLTPSILRCLQSPAVRPYLYIAAVCGILLLLLYVEKFHFAFPAWFCWSLFLVGVLTPLTIGVVRIMRTVLPVYDFPPSQVITYLEKMKDEGRRLSQLSVKEWEAVADKLRDGDDPRFYRWIERCRIDLKGRDLVVCLLIRAGKKKENIKQMLEINDGTYRTMKSRIVARISEKVTIQGAWNDFLKQI